MPAVLGFLFLASVWACLFGLAALAGVVLFPFALLAATVALVAAYCTEATAALLPDLSDGVSPVARPVADGDRDPAYRHYLAAQVWRDWRVILDRAVPLMRARASRGLRRANAMLLHGDKWWLLLPTWLGVGTGIALAAVPVSILVALIAAVYAVTVAAGLLGWIACLGALRAVEQVFTLFMRILQTCPYPGCYARFTQPVYVCPTCDARHRRLRPDLNGAFRHVCACGTRLPTTILLGRYRLQAFCPHCDRRLPARIGRVRVEPLPLVGGPDAGKTTLMALAVDALHGAVTAAGGRVLFADEGDEKAYRRLRRELAEGKISKTLPELPRAVMLDVALPGAAKSGSRILYLFDPSGEDHTTAARVEKMHYLAHGEAIVLVIDPFALPAVKEHLLEPERRMLHAQGVRAAAEDPADTYARLRNELAGRSDGGGQRRVAVVLTKADLLRRTTSGRGAEEDLPGWLSLMGLGNLVRELRHQGVETRYLVSGLPPRRPEIAQLLGWLTGLRLNTPPGEAAATEPGTGEAHTPWKAKPRPAGRVPLGYLILRRVIAAVTIGLSVAMIAVFTLLPLVTRIPEAATAAGGTGGEPLTTPEPLPTKVPKRFAGRWRGTVDQPPTGSYGMALVLRHGRKSGTVSYPDLRCSGSVFPQSTGATDRMELFEQITRDPDGRCVPTDWISLTRTSDGKLHVQIFRNPGDADPVATATLVRDR
ncbi:TRAFAC clade GTPase domain-containing protein [Microbispora siamensis]